MKLEQQVVSLELAQKLKELGVKQESLFSWLKLNDLHVQDWYDCRITDYCIVNEYPLDDIISAFTVAELGEMLPKHYSTLRRVIEGGKEIYICWNTDESDYTNSTFADTEADARAKMLIYLLENKLITV